MTESLNQFATQYAGLLAILGVVVGFISAGVAVYFYYNPRRSSYRLSYKTSAVGIFSSSLYRIRNALISKEDTSSPIFVDMWNSGGDPISSDVIREPILIALQTSATGKGITLTKAEIVRETHPGVSQFEVNMHDAGARLVWKHFDPGMGVRIKLSSSDSVGSDQIAVFGQGLRLDFKRIRNLSELGGLPSVIQKSVVVGVPALIALALGGPMMEWVSRQQLDGPIAYLAFAAVVALTVGGFVAAIAGGFALNSVVEWVFNTKSPIEKVEGDPSIRRRSEFPDRAAYFEARRAELEAMEEEAAAAWDGVGSR